MTTAVQLYEQAFDPYALLQRWQAAHLAAGSYGAAASFVGSMRDFNQGDAIEEMVLEHYSGMTEQQLQEILDEAQRQWPLLDALIAHRIGRVSPGEPIVLTVCWSAHRAAAFDACRYLMEALKSRAPFWKKETLLDNRERWVDRSL